MDQDPPERAATSGPNVASDRIRRVVAGDTAALEWLVAWLNPHMTAWARLQMRPGVAWPMTADDLVQDVWMRVLPELSRLAPHPVKQRWTPALFGIVKATLRHRVVDVRREMSRRVLHGDPGPETAVQWTGADSSSGPVTKALRSERQRLVQQAIERLTSRERALYLRRLFEDASIDELAAEYGMSAAAVVKARQRTRQRLSEFLSPQLLDELDVD